MHLQLLDHRNTFSPPFSADHIPDDLFLVWTAIAALEQTFPAILGAIDSIDVRMDVIVSASGMARNTHTTSYFETLRKLFKFTGFNLIKIPDCIGLDSNSPSHVYDQRLAAIESVTNKQGGMIKYFDLVPARLEVLRTFISSESMCLLVI